MGRIAQIVARQILDSRGIPSLEVDLFTEHGVQGRASVPSGNSTGKYEANEVRDNDKGRYMGMGVVKCVNTVNKIINEELRGQYVSDQSIIDAALIELDGTKNKSNLGANTMLAVSLAAAKAAASVSGQSLYRYIGGVNGNTLPLPLINIISGGKHALNNLDFQEFMIIPNGANSYSEALRMGVEVFRNIELELFDRKIEVSLGLDGAFVPQLKNNEDAIELIIKAIERAKYKVGEQITIAIDAAANYLFDEKTNLYTLKSSNKQYKSDEFIDYWKTLIKAYPIVSLEDPLAEDDWDTWVKLTDILGDKIQIVGDDLFVTNTSRIQQGLQVGAANATIIKPNQIGTLTETINAVELAQNNGMNCIVSHRAGETDDLSIVELAIGLNTGQIKLGATSRGESIIKYNQLLRIEESLGVGARFWGNDFF
ncbi:MAG: phosphopyruvate hydratase [Bacteroidales bacterium]|nr:phosphopyruvate hydratase [Bacteroidales bacterium]